MTLSYLNSTDVLPVFDRLEIGPVKVESRRIIAPYRLFYRDTVESIDLIYSYEERVFDPKDPACQNLANMIAAQVALNYGLFTHRLVFHGYFDSLDQRFIRQMAENTAREIYVKKFLEPNPFLVDDAALLKLYPESKKNYLHARLEFPESDEIPDLTRIVPWNTETKRCAVLSSGGKDSLLSFGLLDELGYETHSIFGNESGRHWFTALNAYKYFKARVPHTARVWTNADRVFVWMLRHMPFIRQDFARLRSDEYPIRLWTVAVFIFGALPILKKNGIARLVIGDEFDTTRRASFKGIPHYDGLYDQSTFFDNALSRYFREKEWNVHQLSILRPLSELLIEKILVNRYPHLQEHQVSCHATHKKGDRVLPCGVCEKCRRIVGMLKALDSDPTRCGYSLDIVPQALKSFISKGVQQESACANQVIHLLLQKNMVQLTPGEIKKLEPHPEVLNLRFDTDHSPIDMIPADLRQALFRIYLQYADGAVERENRQWVPCTSII